MKLLKKKSRKIQNELILPELAINDFLSPHYQQINIKRLQHLSSLKLDLENKKILDLGAGVGDHSIYYLFNNNDVVAVEAREELANFLEKRLDIKCYKIDFENELDKLAKIGKRDVIHCYGLLYHLGNPETFLEQLNLSGDLLLLETCVSPDDAPDEINKVFEDQQKYSQAFSGIGSRPKRKWIFDKLTSIFPYVYLPKIQPKHPEFPVNWNLMKFGENKNLTRTIYIASNNRIHNNILSSEYINEYQQW